MASDEVQNALETLSKQLDSIPDNMRIFSLSIRSLYAENAVGTSSDTAVRFRKLRDDTRNQAVVYVKAVMPLVKQCVSEIKDYFEYYIDLTIDEWWASIADIVEAAKIHKETCEAVITIHKDILTELKKRQDDAKLLVNEMEGLSADYEKRYEELKAKAETKMKWALALAFVPYVNVVAAPMLTIAAQSDLVSSTASKKESEIQFAAAKVASESLIPALAKFIEGLEDIAGFFAVTHQELEAFQDKGGQAMESGSPQRLHYTTMKGKAGRMMAGCSKFFAILPSVSTDLEAIPTEGTDQNYVDKWMEKQMAAIKEKCSSERLVTTWIKAITIGSRKEKS